MFVPNDVRRLMNTAMLSYGLTAEQAQRIMSAFDAMLERSDEVFSKAQYESALYDANEQIKLLSQHLEGYRAREKDWNKNGA